jgi:hypothetical protein
MGRRAKSFAPGSRCFFLPDYARTGEQTLSRRASSSRLEDIRRRRGDEVAADYYAAAARKRQEIAAKWPRLLAIGLAVAVAGVVLLVIG